MNGFRSNHGTPANTLEAPMPIVGNPIVGNPIKGNPTVVLLGYSAGACKVFADNRIPVAIVDDHLPQRAHRNNEQQFLCPSYAFNNTTEAWAVQMCDIAKKLSHDSRPVLFPISDRALLAISRFYELLEPAFVLTTPPPDVIEMLINKVSFAAWAMAHKISIPESFIIRKDEPADFPDTGLPQIIKPDYTFALERFESTKLFSAVSASQIRHYVQLCHQHQLDVVVQTDLSQLSDLQWSLAGLCDRPGHLARAVLALKLRQVPWGASTATETIPMNRQVLDVASRLCAEMNLFGLFELELRPNSDGEPVVIEVNPRIWSQVRLPTVAGMDLLHNAYLAALGRPLIGPDDYRANVGWLSWRRDPGVCWMLLKQRRFPVESWVRSLLHIRVIE